MLEACPKFASADAKEFAELGTDRHSALSFLLCNTAGKLAFDTLDEYDLDGVTWAAEYIKLHAPDSEHSLLVESHVNPLDDDLNPLFEHGGTADVICGPHLFDLKWRERNYDAQMAAYSLALFEQGFSEVTVHILFGATRRAQVYKLDYESARSLVHRVIARSKDESAEPTPCDYCGWCANRLTCKPYALTAKRVAEGYADEPLLAQVKAWHPSEMKSAEEIALGLTIARKLLAPWCKSMEFHAKEAAEKLGFKLPGYELKPKNGKTHISDVAKAHEILSLPVSEFLTCCELRLNTSKKYKERKGVIDVYSKVNEIAKASSAREVKRKLQDVITTGKTSMQLVAVGSEGEEEYSSPFPVNDIPTDDPLESVQ